MPRPEYIEYTVRDLRVALRDKKPDAQVEIMAYGEDGDTIVQPLTNVLPQDPSPEKSTTGEGDAMVLCGPLPEEQTD